MKREIPVQMHKDVVGCSTRTKAGKIYALLAEAPSCLALIYDRRYDESSVDEIRGEMERRRTKSVSKNESTVRA